MNKNKYGIIYRFMGRLLGYEPVVINQVSISYKLFMYEQDYK